MEITRWTKPEDLPQLMTVKEVAQHTGWAEQTVRAKIRNKTLPAIPASDSPHSREYRIPKELYLAFLRGEYKPPKKQTVEDEIRAKVVALRG